MTVESTLTRIPENSSQFQSTKYSFVIPEMPFAIYFCQKVRVPSVGTTAVDVPSPFSTMKRHGDTLQWGELTLSVLLDEELRVWEETLEWLKALTKPTKFPEYKHRNGRTYNLYYDGILTVNTNANVPHMRIKFKDCHPISLGEIPFDVTTSAEDTIVVDITFAYDYFEIERLT